MEKVYRCTIIFLSSDILACNFRSKPQDNEKHERSNTFDMQSVYTSPLYVNIYKYAVLTFRLQCVGAYKAK